MKKILIFLVVLLAFFTTLRVLPAEEPEVDDWYKTQMGTGFGNCGPASAAMAIYWSTGIDLTVQTVRNYIGNPYEDGATAYYHLMAALKYWGAIAYYKEFSGLDEIKDYLDKNMIILFCYETARVEISDGSKYGRTYSSNGGHYSIIYGHYRDWFVVNDPMWGGKDRLYPIDNILDAIVKVIVIEKVYTK
ncbi:MAG TPA: C39 family peptidase [Candidatus Paceibacterota bacterium]|nr:C39 family peptidase [Candidatus Paceibacterota bacterium]